MLRQRRDVGAILRDSLGLYGAHAGRLLAIALAVILPVDVIVFGIGLGELSGAYDASPSTGAQILEIAVTGLVTTPLVTAMVIEVLRAEHPSAARAIQAGLDVFPHLLLVMVLYAAGLLLGFAAFILPGIYVAIKLLFAIQTVVLDKSRGTAALRRSWELTDGAFWRTLGVYVVVVVGAALAGAVIGLPLAAAASGADSAFLGLLGAMLSQVVVAPFVAIATTLLYFDLVERHDTPG
jgi:hypothetical protein